MKFCEFVEFDDYVIDMAFFLSVSVSKVLNFEMLIFS
jgi:hypothetical protein